MVIMYDALLKHINSYSTTPITSNEFDLVKQAFVPRKLKRKEFFLQEGDVCKYFGFIVKGALRVYMLDHKGAEHTLQLAIENCYIGDLESWVKFAPSKLNIDAIEDADLLLITREKYSELLKNCPSFEKMRTERSVSNLIAAEKRIAASNSLSAEERYADFAKENGDLLQRFPQHIIASYLGLTNRQNQVQQKLLEEKDLLMKEIHHRVKNNLGIIISLLESQSLYLNNDAARAAIQDTQNRVHAVFLLHEKLCRSAAVPEVNVNAYFPELIDHLYESFDFRDRNVVITHAIDPIYLDTAEVLPLAVILNEAVTNSLKYAFPGGRRGEIDLTLGQMPCGMVQLQIRDNGVGLPAGFHDAIGKSLGFTLITGLANQLDAYYRIENDGGVIITIQFRPKERRPFTGLALKSAKIASCSECFGER
jgi:two-component sensor histidine kinase